MAAVIGEPTERLVTVLLTLAIPAAPDPDAVQLVADAAANTALQVVQATGVEGQLPTPGATVERAGRTTPWLVVPVGTDIVAVPRRTVRPDPMDPALAGVSQQR